MCPHPAVSVEDRPCWTCGKKGCKSSTCPQKKARSGIKSVEDALPFFGTVNVVTDAEGYTMARKSA